jgi:hypothetical protein
VAALQQDILTFDPKKKKSAYVGREDMLRRQRDKYHSLGVEALTWLDIKALLDEAEAYAEGVGQEERFTGLLTSYFPTHDYEEMKFFKQYWASGKLIWQFRREALNNEGAYTDGSHYSWNNEMERQCTLFWQPIDEIRDYFGDETALYRLRHISSIMIRNNLDWLRFAYVLRCRY